jgi:hypothetical protein
MSTGGQVQRKQRKTIHTKTLRVNGQYKLIISSADDGTQADCNDIQREIQSDRNNRILVNQLATDKNYEFEYKNRTLLSHNHRGGITFSVDTPQEAARCMNLGIYLDGRKHRVFAYTRSRAEDLCIYCSSWGHLQRNCTATLRCGTCSEKHRTSEHINLRNGKNKIVCPNCAGNHRVYHSSCKAKALAEEKQSKQEMTPRKDERLESPKKKSLEKKGKKRKGRMRGAQKRSGPGRQ